jgi:hypothetical protein
LDLVIGAFSEYRITFSEPFRFEELVAFLKSDGRDGEALEEQDDADEVVDGLWEAKTATMTLLNAFSNCLDDLEQRIMIREELSRRGLNEAIVVCYFEIKRGHRSAPAYLHSKQAIRYMHPPDNMLKQLSVYTEEKFEDEEDLREKSLLLAQRSPPRGHHTQEISEGHEAYLSLMKAAKLQGHDGTYALLKEVMRSCKLVLDRVPE